VPEKIEITGRSATRMQDTGKALPRIEPDQFAAALGAEPLGERVSAVLDPISLAELGSELIRRLRSSSDRPAPPDPAERCKTPLSPKDIAALEQIIAAIEQETGARPSLGQIAGVILRVHLDSLKNGRQAS
jgi:hypothetical protein